MQINERIKALREDKDLTQAYVSSKIEVTRRQYIRYEQGEQEMTVSRLKALCEFYGVSADYILGLPQGLSWPRTSHRGTHHITSNTD